VILFCLQSYICKQNRIGKKLLFLSKNIWWSRKSYLYLYTKKFKLVNIMKDRIIKILDKENISAAKFADVLGVQRSSISHILSGRNKPSLDFVQRILQKFPNINSDWLLFGKGNIYRNAPEEEQSAPITTPTPASKSEQPKQAQQVMATPSPQKPAEVSPAPTPTRQPVQQQPVYQQIPQQPPVYQQPMPQQPMYQQPQQPQFQQQQPRPIDILQTNPDRIIVFYSNNTFAWYSPMNNQQQQPQGVYK
jgi:transcriptional regulator with XRE-family HTH domain